jgi:predicted type IV restriction endonuclease
VLIGLDVYREVHSSTGRCDILVFTDQYIYTLELKLNGSAKAALDQIFEKGVVPQFDYIIFESDVVVQ